MVLILGFFSSGKLVMMLSFASAKSVESKKKS